MGLAALLLRAPLKAQPDPTLHERILDFERVWHPFILKLYGCRGLDVKPDECRPALGATDYRLWQKARRAAAKLFDLLIEDK